MDRLKPSQLQPEVKFRQMKSLLRKQLLDRCKKDRSFLCNAKRKIDIQLADYLTEENVHELMVSDQEKFSVGNNNFSSQYSYEEFLSLLKETSEEVMNQIEVNYFDSVQFGTSLNVNSEIDSNNSVLCPICRCGSLEVKDSEVFCTRALCSMKLNTEQPQIPLSFVKKQLAVAHEEHRIDCVCFPVFAIDECCGVQNLFMVGSTCDFFTIIF